MHDTHSYALVFARTDGTPVGQVPLTVDWEPARECLRFSVLRRHGVVLPPSDADQVEPQWVDGVGEPFVGAVRVTIEADDDEVASREFGATYFSGQVEPAVQRLVGDGRARPGETLRYHVVAFAREPSRVTSRFSSEAVASPAPCRVTRLDLLMSGSCGVGRGDPEDVPVFLRPGVLREARRLAMGAGGVETGGVLIGHLHRDPERAALFLEVTAQVPARERGSSTHLTFTSQTWTEIGDALRRGHQGEIMLGWWHSHPVREWCKPCPIERQRVCAFRRGFLSADDRLLHRTVFPRAYTVALLLSDVAEAGITYRMFGWRDGVIQPRAFHLLDPAGAPPVVESSTGGPEPVSESAAACEKTARR